MPVAASRAQDAPASASDSWYADACVAALVDRNSGVRLKSRRDFKSNLHFDVPDSAFAEACQASSGDADSAWAYMIRKWPPPEVKAAGYGAPASFGWWAMVVPAIAMTLVYAILGRPIWALLRIAMPHGRQGMLAAQFAVCAAARVVVAAALLAVVKLPFGDALASVALLAALVRTVSRPAGRLGAAASGRAGGAFAETLAGTINDTVAAIPGLLALALLCRGSWLLLLFGLMPCLLLTAPATRRLRRIVSPSRPAFAVGAVCLALLIGWQGASDPAVLRAAGGPSVAPQIAAAAIFALILVWRARNGSRHLSALARTTERPGGRAEQST